MDPPHFNMPGNKVADKLTKESGRLPEPPMDITCDEAKRVIRSRYRTKWESQQLGYQKGDAFYQLHRSEESVIFRLCTWRNRLKYHLSCKLKIGDTDELTVELVKWWLKECSTLCTTEKISCSQICSISAQTILSSPHCYFFLGWKSIFSLFREIELNRSLC